ncbi:hypothetical protein Droror1_Dr00025812 [Drosera rotundifolia]
MGCYKFELAKVQIYGSKVKRLYQRSCTLGVSFEGSTFIPDPLPFAVSLRLSQSTAVSRPVNLSRLVTARTHCPIPLPPLEIFGRTSKTMAASRRIGEDAGVNN